MIATMGLIKQKLQTTLSQTNLLWLISLGSIFLSCSSENTCAEIYNNRIMYHMANTLIRNIYYTWLLAMSTLFYRIISCKNEIRVEVVQHKC